MSATLKNLYTENENPFKLSLCAGQSSIRNKVTWVYMLEDEYIIPYFHGSELSVTAGYKASQDPDWLMTLVRSLAALSGRIRGLGQPEQGRAWLC